MITEEQRAGLKAFTVKHTMEGLFAAVAVQTEKALAAGADLDTAEIAGHFFVLVQGLAEVNFELAMAVTELTEHIDKLQGTNEALARVNSDLAEVNRIFVEAEFKL